MTLVEMLVAMTMTLIVMGIVAQLFGFIAMTLSRSRNTIEMSTDVRSVANLLRRDLAGLTVKTLPPAAADGDCGYLEVLEGSASDQSAGFAQLTGDCDDAVLFTTRSIDGPFVGRFTNGVAANAIESPVAEVAWFCLPSPAAFQTVAGSTLYTLYRRQLLVMEYVGAGDFDTGGANRISDSLPAAYAKYDLSLRADASFLRPNSLGDLTRREFRFMHDCVGPPSTTRFPYNSTAANLLASGALSGARLGEDIILTNVLAFDVRVFDPRAPIQSTSSTPSVAITPGDPGYGAGAVSGVSGAYVDLGWASSGTLTAIGSSFPTGGLTALGSPGVKVSNTPNNRSMPGTYDTWSTHYEFNGIDDDGDGIVDEGTNGIDDDANGIVDDALEQETSPPYPVALRGIEIRIRCYEPSSRQVRQMTVRHTFVPH